MEKTDISVLVVEDNPAQVKLLCENLRTSGYGLSFTIASASSLDETLEFLRKNEIDALLLDLSLPDSCGIETVERVRANFPHTPIVVLTGNEDEAVSLMAVKMGAQDYLIKGQVDQKALIRSILYAIERKKAELEIRKARERLEIEVLARTAQIRKANEKLKKIVREKTRGIRVHLRHRNLLFRHY